MEEKKIKVNNKEETKPQGYLSDTVMAVGSSGLENGLIKFYKDLAGRKSFRRLTPV